MITKKRFTNAAKWQNPAFRQIPNEFKLLWLYLLDTCDAAGLWQVDFEAVNFYLGASYTAESALIWLDDEIIVLNDSLWFIPQFITLQYHTLNERASPHRGAIQRLTDAGLDWQNLPKKKKGPDFRRLASLR